MATAHVRGVDLYYEAHGSGPHLVLAHGLLGSVAYSSAHGARAEDIAAHGLHVVAYDARGHGRSGFTSQRGDYRYTALAADLCRLLDALGIERASIGGGSMGAGTALTFALDFPDRVDRLVLWSPPTLDDAMWRRVVARCGFHALAWSYFAIGVSLTARIVALPYGEPERGRMRALLNNQRRAAVVPAIRGLFSGPLIPLGRLSAIDAPTLVLTQPNDVLHPLRSGEILRERMPHVTLAVGSSAGYWRESPQAMTKAIASFVKAGSYDRANPKH